jgi:hypothetical protein
MQKGHKLSSLVLTKWNIYFTKNFSHIGRHAETFDEQIY